MTQIRKADDKMLYVVLGYDGTDEGALLRRQAVRPAHLEWVKTLKEAGIFKCGGALLDDDGKMIGSMMILDYPAREALDTEFFPKEPYAAGEVWKTIHVHPFQAPPDTFV